MTIQPRYGFAGQVKSIMFQCYTCDIDGLERKLFDVELEVDSAYEAAMSHSDQHLLLDTPN